MTQRTTSQFGFNRQTPGDRAAQTRTGAGLLVVIPVYNDWEAVSVYPLVVAHAAVAGGEALRRVMTFSYQGGELEVFQHAVHWKSYYASHLRPLITGDTLEVGAGLGGTSRFLCDCTQRSWTCLEPDTNLRGQLEKSLASMPRGVPTRVLPHIVAEPAPNELFDTIIYIDVLEHIEDDCLELEPSAAHLSPAGTIIVLAPAHDWLFSPFDRAVGHYRRYSKSRLAALTPESLELISAFYLDSVGMLASVANKPVLKQGSPTHAQISFWDSTLVPISRVLDPLTGRRIGKTVIAAWRMAPDAGSA